MLPSIVVMIGRGASSSTMRTASTTMRRAVSLSPTSRILAVNQQLLHPPKCRSNPAVVIKSSSRMMSSTRTTTTATTATANSRLQQHQRFVRPSVLLLSRALNNTKPQQRRAFHGYNSGELPSCLEPKLLPSHEIALDVVGWYVGLALLYPLYLRSSDGEGIRDDDGSWRDADAINDDGDVDGKSSKKTVNKTSSSSSSHKKEGDHRH
mmetsp:Transcript_54405/g.132053  ORF Transcript_54405/g.132053 Transcript_54405/m.132053 type:complete len:208 (+) Transcript_54405:1423-2046(+)